MLFSTYWKCLLTDGDMCWQTLPHFVQKEGREKGWGGKQNLISNGTTDAEEEGKREITKGDGERVINFNISMSKLYN